VPGVATPDPGVPKLPLGVPCPVPGVPIPELCPYKEKTEISNVINILFIVISFIKLEKRFNFANR
jgi:hypothetical protein